MKQRVISGIVIAIIIVTSILCGGLYYSAVTLFVGLAGTYEIVKCVSRKNDYLLMLIVGTTVLGTYFIYDARTFIYIFEFVILFAIAEFDKKYLINDIALIFMVSYLLGNFVFYLKYLRDFNKFILGFIIIASLLTDVFAYFIGSKYGKRKLNERVSPHKSVEGAIGGWACGALLSFVWAIFCSYFHTSVLLVLFFSLTLPITSQLGDLAFSLIKRHYQIKDFSHLIPGHGGILDRLDSVSFCVVFLGTLLYLFR